MLTGSHTITQANVDAGKVTNTATATATGAATKAATRETTVAQTRAITLEKTATASGFGEVDDELSYSYKVTNSGTVTLTGTLAIQDDKISSTSIECPSVPETGVAPAGSLTCTGSYTVVQGDLDAGGVVNKATATLDGLTSQEDEVQVSWRSPQTRLPQLTLGGASLLQESAGSISLPVTLSPSSLQTVTVEYSTSDVTAVAGQDYTGPASGSTLTFAPGDTSKSVTVAITDDNVDEDNETFTVALSNAANATIVSAVGTSTVTIADDDTAGVTVSETSLNIEEGGAKSYTVVLDSQPTASVTVTVNDPSNTYVTADPASLTFAAGDWDDEQTVTVSAAQDTDVADDTATVTHTVSSLDTKYNGISADDVRVTVTDAGHPQVSVTFGQASYAVAEGNSRTVEVELDKDPVRTVTIPITKTEQDGASSADYSGVPANVTFNSGETEKSFTLTATSDTEDDDGESVKLGLGTLPTDVSAGAIHETVVSITDDDVPAVTVAFEQDSYTVAEGSNVSIKVTLNSDPERTVTIPLTKTDQGGASSGDYSGVPDSVAFNSGDTEKSFSFAAADDDIDDDGESVKLGFGTTLPAGVSAGSTDEATVSITDDDTAGVTVEPTTLSVDEGGSGTYTVALDTQPTAAVTVTIGGTSGDVSTDETDLTFTSVNWSSAQTVTVSADADADAVSDPLVTLTHAVSTTASEYDSVTASSVTVNVIEKDGVVLSVADAQAAEDGGNVAFQVTISLSNDQVVTVDYATSDSTATAGQDYTATSGSLTFPAGSSDSQTVQVPVIDDPESEGPETFALTLSGVQNATLAGGGATLAATGTIVDNDDPQVTVSFEQATYSVDEGQSVTVTIALSEDPQRNVTIPLTKSNQDGASDADYSGVPTSVAFNSGNTATAFTITATDDQADDDGESVKLTFGTLPDGVSAGSTEEATVSITDNDATPPPPVRNRPPVFPQGEVSRSVAENSPEGDPVGAPVTATDQDSGDTLTYSLEGADAGAFTIDNDGQIRVGAGTVLDYEAGQNTYQVVVRASDGTASAITGVTITVTNVEEAGRVTISPSQPGVDEEVTASLADPDGSVGDVGWQWARSDDPSDPESWTDISDATSDTYTPETADLEHYLRATAGYTDGHGPDKIARGVSDNPVATEPGGALPGITIRRPGNDSGAVAEGTDLLVEVVRTNGADGDLNGVRLRVSETGDTITGTMTLDDGQGGLSALTVTPGTVVELDLIAGIAAHHLALSTEDDEAHEENSEVTFQLLHDAGDPARYTVGHPDAVTIMVNDNDDAPPQVEIEFSPSDSVPEGTEITATMRFGNLSQGPSDTYFVAQVPGAEDCQGQGLDRRRFLDLVDQNPEVRTGTIADTCPVGRHDLEVTLYSGDGEALASATAGFSITTPEPPLPVITLRRYEDETPREVEEGTPLVLQMARSNREDQTLSGVMLQVNETGDTIVGNLLTGDALGGTIVVAVTAGQMIDVEFLPGQETKRLWFDTLDDAVAEANSEVTFRVMPDTRTPAGYVVGSPSVITIMVMDNDKVLVPTPLPTPVPSRPSDDPDPTPVPTVAAAPTPVSTPAPTVTLVPTPVSADSGAHTRADSGSRRRPGDRRPPPTHADPPGGQDGAHADPHPHPHPAGGRTRGPGCPHGNSDADCDAHPHPGRSGSSTGGSADPPAPGDAHTGPRRSCGAVADRGRAPQPLVVVAAAPAPGPAGGLPVVPPAAALDATAFRRSRIGPPGTDSPNNCYFEMWYELSRYCTARRTPPWEPT